MRPGKWYGTRRATRVPAVWGPSPPDFRRLGSPARSRPLQPTFSLDRRSKRRQNADDDEDKEPLTFETVLLKTRPWSRGVRSALSASRFFLRGWLVSCCGQVCFGVELVKDKRKHAQRRSPWTHGRVCVTLSYITHSVNYSVDSHLAPFQHPYDIRLCVEARVWLLNDAKELDQIHTSDSSSLDNYCHVESSPSKHSMSAQKTCDSRSVATFIFQAQARFAQYARLRCRKFQLITAYEDNNLQGLDEDSFNKVKPSFDLSFPQKQQFPSSQSPRFHPLELGLRGEVFAFPSFPRPEVRVVARI
jgi:hypothetical protein